MLQRGLFVGNRAEAEQFKGLITEPSYRSEKKFCEPLQITSYHNFVGASNSHKAVAISTDDRRYWMKNTVGMKYPDEHWATLWKLVDNPIIREVFYQYLVNCVDLTGFPQRAPMTSSKAEAAAEQCPVGIKWRNHRCWRSRVSEHHFSNFLLVQSCYAGFRQRNIKVWYGGYTYQRKCRLCHVVQSFVWHCLSSFC